MVQCYVRDWSQKIYCFAWKFPELLWICTCLCTPHLVAATHTWHHLNQISLVQMVSSKISFIRPQDMVLGIHVLSLLVCRKPQAGFLVDHLPSGMTALETNLMQCVAYGLITDRLTPYPFNLCSNAGSTHTSISQSQPLDMTLSTGIQLLWSTMVKSVLSGSYPVKPLYRLGHHAAAQFQGFGNLLIA